MRLSRWISDFNPRILTVVFIKYDEAIVLDVKPPAERNALRHRRRSNRGRQPAVFRARRHSGMSPDPAHLSFQPACLCTPGLDWYVQPYLY